MSAGEPPPLVGVMEDIQQEDPFDWSIDQVVAALCDPNSPFLRSRPRTGIPNLPSLELSLRENEVDGTTLLTGINGPELRDDLGVRKLGERTTMLNMIRILRVRSNKYQENAPEMGLAASPLEFPRFATPSSRHVSVTPGMNYPRFQSPAHQHQYERARSMSNSGQTFITPTTPNGFAAPSRISEDPTGSSKLGEPSQFGLGAMTQLEELPDPEGGALQILNRDSVVPSSKRKTSEPDRTIAEHPETHPDTGDHSISSERKVENNAMLVDSGKKRRRLEPQNVTSDTGVVRDPRFDVPLANSTPQEDLSVVDLFFPADQTHHYEGPQAFYHKDPQAFSKTERSQRYSLTVYRNRLMKYFFRQPFIELGVHDGKECTAVVPYSRKLVRGSEPQFVSVYAKDKKDVTVRKEPLSDWPDLEVEVLEQHDSGDQAVRRFKKAIQFDKAEAVESGVSFDPVVEEKAFWARFEKYHQTIKPDDEAEVLPRFGDSDSEDAYDSEEARDHEESNTPPPKPQTLSKEDISRAVDEAIAMIVEKWRTQRLPVIEKKAWKVWRKSRHENNKNAQIRDAQFEIAHAKKRTKELRSSIENDVWPNAKDVHRACGVLEVHIEDSEELMWKIRVLELNKCPLKPPPEPKNDHPKPARSRPASLADDEEILEREGVAGSESELDDFVVQDDLIAEPTTSIPLIGDIDAASGFADVEDAMDVDDDRLGKPEPEDDSEDDIVSPQSRRLKKRNALLSHVEISANSQSYLSVTSPQLSSPKRLINGASQLPMTPRKQGKADVIDLTISSQESSKESRRLGPPFKSTRLKQGNGEHSASPDQSPRLKLILKDRRPPGFHVPPYGFLVDNETSGDSTAEGSFNFHEVANLTYDELEIRHDRRRLVLKSIHDMPEEYRSYLVDVLHKTDTKVLQHHVWLALDALKKDEKGIQGLDSKTNKGLMNAAILWIKWVNCGSGSHEMHEMHRTGVPLTLITSALSQPNGFPAYDSFLQSIFRSSDPIVIDSSPEKGSRKKLGRKTSLHGSMFVEPPTTEDSSDDAFSQAQIQTQLTPHKTRKRAVKQDMAARATRIDDQRRVEDSQKAQTLVKKSLMSKGISNDDPDHQAVSFNDPIIYLHPHIGRLVKPHQLGGIQFMWREVIEDKKRQGCLLAHTMGLGKTMQVISLLVTIASGLNSTDPAIRGQLPRSWKRTNALIMCPPGLIDNWNEELNMWAPDPLEDSLIRIYILRSDRTGTTALPDRLGLITKWHENGGVLVMSYDYFRTLVLNKETKVRGQPLTAVQYSKLERELLIGPDIIIADEAHKLKNTKSAVSEAASRFRSKSRIALTGSPLANHLEEYYAMINWVAPGYLGDAVEFRSKYVEPIREGLFCDSTPTEKRRALTKLSILNKNLDPKINRADISCMKNDLPSKTEFVITVPLTQMQEKVYSIFVGAQRHGGGEISQTRLFDWLRMLALVCNHPYCFKERLEEREERVAKVSKAVGDSRKNSNYDETSAASDNEMADPPSPSTSGMSKELVNQLLSYLDAQPELMSPSMSNKTQILSLIVDESVNAGDKLLIFSQSIPTLDYLEWLLVKHKKIACDRLDGKTAMTSRQGTAKAFNQVDSGRDVFLISTKAGGLGLNLYGANRVVIFDFDFNPTHEEQAVGRAYRYGQRKPVFVYRFKAGGTFEDIVEMKTVFKTQLASRVVDRKNPVRFATKSAKDYLFEPKEVEQRDVDEYLGKDPAVLDKILKQDLGCIKALDLTETFHTQDDEKLTAEEEREVQLELQGELLKRDDPEKYQQWLKKRQAEEMAKRPVVLQSTTALSTNGAGPSTQIPSRPVPSQQQPRNNSFHPGNGFTVFPAATQPQSQAQAHSRTTPRVPPTTPPKPTVTNPSLVAPTTFPSNGLPSQAVKNFLAQSRPNQPTVDPNGKTGNEPVSALEAGGAMEGVEKSNGSPLTQNGLPSDHMEGVEKANQDPDADEDDDGAEDRAKWQEQLRVTAENAVLPIPAQSESGFLNALEIAFQADEHIVRPLKGSPEWNEMMKKDYTIWKDPFLKARALYDKNGEREAAAERTRVLGNALELHWSANKGWEEQKQKAEVATKDGTSDSATEETVSQRSDFVAAANDRMQST